MSFTSNSARVVLALLCLMVWSSAGQAEYMGPRDASSLVRSGSAPQDKTALFEFAPFKSQENSQVAVVANPLGLGSDPDLTLFSGTMHYADLLSHFEGSLDILDHSDVTLPAGTVRQQQLIRNYVQRFFSGDVRAVDASLYNLRKARVRTWLGLPVTHETHPLSLAGFGSVSEYMKPVARGWNECDNVERRQQSMEDLPPHLRKKNSGKPNICFKI